MKRALLIAGGTVGGLGAVLAITPPQFTATQSVDSLSGGLPMGSATQKTPAATQPAQTPTATKAAATKSAVATQSAKPASTKKASTQLSATASATQSAASDPTPTPTATKTTTAPAPAADGYSGTVTGASFNARNYGTLSATVTFSNGKITNVGALQSPSSWSQNSLPTLIPYASSGKITVEQIKTYAAEQLPCAISNSCRSQASFTATAFWSSVKSAINKAGL